MTKKALMAAMVLALGSGAAQAGYLSLDPTGAAPGGATNLDLGAIGSSEGNFVITDIHDNTIGGTSSMIFGHNSINLSTFGITGELTLQFEIAVTPTVTGPANTIGEQLSWVLDTTRVSEFRLYFDDGSGVAANQATGAGYGDGVLIASSNAITFGDLLGPGLTNLSGGTIPVPIGDPDDLDDNNDGLVDLADNNTTPTIATTGSARLRLGFLETDLNTDYIVNDLFSLVIDLTTVNALSTPFDEGDGGTVLASSSVVGHSASFGGDGINNFRCSGTTSLGICDFQAQMNTTFLGGGNSIPEPGTLALIGAGLSLVGVNRRRRRKA